MNVFEAVQTVLAVRVYQDKPIPADVIFRIVEAARLTASSMNQQPWHFIVVEDRATALAKGTSNSKRSSSASASIPALAGPTRGRILPNLAQLQGSQQLDGQGATTREMALTATLTGRITHVLPNGNFVVEGSKEVIVNAERQTVTVRGVGRWTDLTAGNQLASDRLGYLEIKVQGKGIVGDAVRRPNFLYRLLLGLLPF